VINAKRPEYVTFSNSGPCDNRSMGLVVTFSQFYLKLNNLFVR